MADEAKTETEAIAIKPEDCKAIYLLEGKILYKRANIDTPMTRRWSGKQLTFNMTYPSLDGFVRKFQVMAMLGADPLTVVDIVFRPWQEISLEQFLISEAETLELRNLSKKITTA